MSFKFPIRSSLGEGDVVRIFSPSADSWIEGEVMEVGKDHYVRVEYELADGWHSRTLHVDSEDFAILSPEHDPGAQLHRGHPKYQKPPEAPMHSYDSETSRIIRDPRRDLHPMQQLPRRDRCPPQTFYRSDNRESGRFIRTVQHCVQLFYSWVDE